MSTIYVYPLPSRTKPEPSILKSLDSTELSRILDIPLGLLETANNDDFFKNQFWLPPPSTATNTAIISADQIQDTEFDINTAQDYVNRKRSMVKRRKSVLSASFTASEEDIMRHKEEHKVEEEAVLEEEDEEDEEEMAIYHDKEQTNHFYSQENLTFNLQDDNNNNSVYYTNYDEITDTKNTLYPNEETYHITSILDTPKQEKPIANLQDSAIDLSIGSYPTTKDQADVVVELPPLDAPAKKTKKKVSSWSPRRIFSSSSNTPSTKKLNKKQSSSSLNSIESVESNESKERFHFSSLFSRKSGTKKSKQPSAQEKQPQSQPKQLSSSNTNLFNHTRLPINTERAIYRLSHIKLTNPRLPLRDQVVISNHMYWYLSIISANNESSTNVHQMIAMTKRHHRMQYQQKKGKKQNPRRPTNEQKTPQNKRMITAKRYPSAQLNSSSDDDDDSEDDLLDSDSDDDDDDENDAFNLKKPQLKNVPPLNNRNAKFKQTVKPRYSNHDEEEDDIPLAMYQKAKKAI
ncbi:hypothetical protein A0J61_09983 [Choanephora cucurbitarum]|uniref:Protein Zds1 C-terminal domain-containing protein n=1 Tax=Choanephora cucurbitarum TaxID=101091 RepID=A0A1C7MYR2_9FUNG|nr:hypothetical protein A0J61_09983 [Choanephora cucurbitarum]